MNIISVSRIVLATAIVYSLSTTVHAEETPLADQPSESAASGQAELQEIVVTAQRRAERLQEVPIAVNAISGEVLQQNDISTFEDLTATTPGFVATNNVSYGAAPLSIRGVGGANGGANFFNDEPVAVYVDGIYIGRLSFSTSDLLDVDAVQVLRGPQTTLYGRNATGGAILVGTRRPTETFEGHVRAGYTSLDDWRVEGVVSGPLSESLSGRLALAYGDRRGYGTNTVNGRRVGGSEDFSGRASLRFKPSGDFTADLILERLEQDSVPATLQVAQVTGGPNDSPFIVRPDLKQRLKDKDFTFDDPNFFSSKTTAATLLVNWDLGFATLDYLASFRRVNSNGAQDTDGTALANNGADFVRSNNRGILKNDQYTQEIRLTSPTSAGFRWILGAFYIHEDNDVIVTINNYRGFANLGTNATFTGKQKLDAYAAFADLSYEVTDALTLTVGGRYSHEQKDFSITQRVTTLSGGFAPPVGMVVSPGFVVAAPPIYVDAASFNDFSLRAVADYKLSEDIMAYVSYSEGFKSGGFNAFGLVPAFDPEDIKAYELGLKTESADRRARLNANIFQYDYSDLQIRLAVPTGGVSIQNAAAARVRGAEVEGSFIVAGGLKLNANIAYLDAEFTEGTLTAVPSSARYRYGTSIPLVSENIAGNRLSRAPRWQAALSGEYSFPIQGLGEGRISATYKYQTNVFYLETNQTEPTFRSGAWSEVGARFTLTSEGKRWEVAVFAENIFNDRHLTQVSALASFPTAAVNEPRKFGIQAKFRFD